METKGFVKGEFDGADEGVFKLDGVHRDEGGLGFDVVPEGFKGAVKYVAGFAGVEAVILRLDFLTVEA